MDKMEKNTLKIINKNSIYHEYKNINDLDKLQTAAITRAFYSVKWLDLREEQWDYLIKNSDLMNVGAEGLTPLIAALMRGGTLFLKEEQWDYLIKNSDLIHKDAYNWDALHYAAYFNNKEVAIKIIRHLLKKKKTFFNSYYDKSIMLKGYAQSEKVILGIKDLVETIKVMDDIEKKVVNNKKKKENKL